MLLLLCLAVPLVSMFCLAAKLRHTTQLCQALQAWCSVSGQQQQSQHQHQQQHQQRGLSSAAQGTANQQQQAQQPQHQLPGVPSSTQGAANHQQVAQLQAERDALQHRYEVIVICCFTPYDVSSPKQVTDT